MARSGTNTFGLRYGIETSLGVKPTSGWRTLEPNNPSAFGAAITTVERRPISPERGRKKGTVVNSESSVEYEGDLTMDAFTDFAEGFVFAEWANKEFDFKTTGGLLPPPVASSTTWTIASLSALMGGKLLNPISGSNPLLYGKGYTNSANNGYHTLTTDAASTDVVLTTGSTLVTETPPTNASLQMAGYRMAIGDLALTVSGSTATLVSAADIPDWSAIGLFVGQYIHIGSDDQAGARQNMFDDGSGGDVYGYARITSISGATLNLDKLDVNLDTTDASNATLVDVLYGRFCRNVSTTAASDDSEFVERSYAFEGLYSDLGGVGTDEYEYAVGNMCNELAINLPLNEKATATWGFIGTVTDDITASRATGPSASINPLRTEAINTASGLAAITTDVVSSVSDVCFKSLTLSIKNNVSPENCLGTLGASFMNSGLFEVNLEGQMLFTNKEITNAVKNNTTVTFAVIMKNGDGALVIDIPSLTIGDGAREFPVDESILVNISGLAFNDPTGTVPDVSIGISMFADVPESRV